MNDFMGLLAGGLTNTMGAQPALNGLHPYAASPAPLGLQNAMSKMWMAPTQNRQAWARPQFPGQGRPQGQPFRDTGHGPEHFYIGPDGGRYWSRTPVTGQMGGQMGGGSNLMRPFWMNPYRQ